MRSDGVVRPDSKTIDLTPFCLKMRANEISDGAGEEDQGAQVGTKAAYLAVEGWDDVQLKQVASGEHLVLPCKNGSDPCLPSKLRIAVKDIFKQTITRGIEDANLRLTLVSNNIVGDLRYKAVEGIAVINNTMAWGVGISSNVTIVSESNPHVQLVLLFSTRKCRPGERHQEETCKSCLSEQYGFDPSLDCRGCEDNAKCAGGAALVPSNGYWHSSPFSPCIHKCVHSDACTYPDRERTLTEFYENASRVDENLAAVKEYVREGPRPTFPEYRQCAEGYEGVLCGSCQNGYGHSYTDACQKCPESNAKIWICFLLGLCWLFFLIGANCLVTLMSTSARVSLVKHELRCAIGPRARTLARARPIRRSLKNASAISRRTTSASSIPYPIEPYVGDRQRWQLGLLRPPDPRYLGRAARRDGAVDRNAESKRAAEAGFEVCFVVQVLINYLQVTSAALRLQTDWSPALNTMLTAEGRSSHQQPSLYCRSVCSWDRWTVQRDVGRATGMQLRWQPHRGACFH